MPNPMPLMCSLLVAKLMVISCVSVLMSHSPSAAVAMIHCPVEQLCAMQRINKRYVNPLLTGSIMRRILLVVL